MRICSVPYVDPRHNGAVVNFTKGQRKNCFGIELAQGYPNIDQSNLK